MDFDKMSPYEVGQYASGYMNSGGMGGIFHRTGINQYVAQNYGTYGDAQYGEYLSGLNAGTAGDVEAFYAPYTPMPSSGGFYQGGGMIDPTYNPYSTIDINRYDHLDKKDNPGDKLYADLIRAQTDDYLNRYAPIEDYMAGQITKTGTRSLYGDLQRTGGAVLGAAKNVDAQQKRAMYRMGIAQQSDSRNNMSTVSAFVGGLNDTRLRDADRRDAILSGNLGAISQKARGNV